MLPSFFDYIFVHLRQIMRLRTELSPKFLSTLDPNSARFQPEKPGRTYNSGLANPLEIGEIFKLTDGLRLLTDDVEQSTVQRH